ncbi:MAG: hypothetical protein JST20_04240 [Bacteroidetes bacterium]|nr:hypothetical protein [Bacteroidota bacterium]
MFNLNVFNDHLTAVNKHISRYRESNLTPLINQLATLNGPATPEKKKAIQTAIFNIPYDRHVKYKRALDYLAQELGVKIVGCPVQPTMQLQRSGTSEFSYSALDNEDKPNLSTAIPGFIPVQSFHHVMEFRWKSSTGNLASLQKVGVREFVKFRVPPDSPPFNEHMAGVMEFYHGNSSEGANLGYGRDDHFTKPPSLICRMPFVAGEVVLEQWYQFTIDNQATYENIPGAAYLLTKGVRKSGDDWVFFFKKQNWEPHNTVRFNFEVEYLLTEPYPRPKPGSKLNRPGQIEDKVLSKYAHKVISLK